MIFTKIISKTVVFIVTNAFYIYEKLLCGKKFEKRVTTKFFKNFIISLCSNCVNRHRTVFLNSVLYAMWWIRIKGSARYRLPDPILPNRFGWFTVI